MNCVVNFANNRGNYLKGQKRLVDSLRNVGYEGEILTFQNEGQLNCPTHKDNPYAFKIYAIDKARELGYKNILYLDASVWAVKSVDPVFEVIENEGYIMQEAGHFAGNWSNDNCLNWFGISREEAKGMLMYGNAGFLGLNFDNPIAYAFFERWKASMEAGCFKGSWSDHRHDMTCGSIIANQLGMVYKKGSEYLAYVGGSFQQPGEEIIFYAQGL